MKKNRIRIVVSLLLVFLVPAIVYFAPILFGSHYVTELIIQAMIFGILALSLNLLLGYLGLPSLGHAAYFGVSAYTVAICMTKFHMGWIFSSVAGVFAAIVIGGLFGIFALRARGVYFLMITLALAMIVWGLAYRWVSMSSGDMGIAVPRPSLGALSFDKIENFFYFVAPVFALSVLVMARIARSPFGLTLLGIKESETRMRTLGYNCWLHQYICFLISSLFAGVAGVLFVFYNRFISPHSVDVVPNMEILLMVALGGPGTITGPLVGAVLIVFLKNFVSIYTNRWVIILGTIYIVTVLYAPKGLLEVKNSAIGLRLKSFLRPVLRMARWGRNPVGERSSESEQRYD